MSKYLFIASFILLAMSCNKDKVVGSGDVISETRIVPTFTGVSSSGSTDIFISKDKDINVEAKAYASLLPYLETNVDNNTLLVGYKNQINVSNDNSEVFVKMPALYKVSTSGNANINASGEFNTTQFEATTSGSGDIILPSGSVKYLTIKTTGSGNVNGLTFAAENIDITITGSGDVRVNATGNLKFSISGSGNVYYTGNPKNITSDITGSGKLIKQY